MKESVVEDALVDETESWGGECIKFTSPNKRGVPDRIVVLPGGLVGFVECKRPTGGKASALQARQLDQLRLLGVHTALVSTVAEAVGTVEEWAREGIAMRKIGRRLNPKEVA